MHSLILLPVLSLASQVLAASIPSRQAPIGSLGESAVAGIAKRGIRKGIDPRFGPCKAKDDKESRELAEYYEYFGQKFSVLCPKLDDDKKKKNSKRSVAILPTPVPAGSVATTTMPRLVLYQQTYHVMSNGSERYISMLPLIQQSTGVTHVILSAIHLNDNAQVTLNDHHPSDARFQQMWNETEQLKAQGVKVMGMLGGAAQGSYQKLNQQFDTYYPVLLDVIRTYRLQGIDLDVEEYTPLELMVKLITQLNQDLGPDFIISLAPVYTAMLPRSRIYHTLHHRVLNSTALPPPDPVTKALCSAPYMRSARNLSGFSYLDLEVAVGPLIHFYNVQFYNGFGDASLPANYHELIRAGWKSSKIVMGVLTCPANGHGHVETVRLAQTVRSLSHEYLVNFGGVMGWEYFNADGHVSENPWKWVEQLGRALGRIQ